MQDANQTVNSEFRGRRYRIASYQFNHWIGLAKRAFTDLDHAKTFAQKMYGDRGIHWRIEDESRATCGYYGHPGHIEVVYDSDPEDTKLIEKLKTVAVERTSELILRE